MTAVAPRWTPILTPLAVLALWLVACSQAPIRPPGASEPIMKQRVLAPIRGALDRPAFAGVELARATGPR
jgi:hypothetical protein